jgi:AcrR family transcriptional regulator
VASEKRGDRARAALIENAERLFAERGIEAVSLRDVCAAAGQRNHNAAQYHFGDREGLVAAVYEARMRLVDERRHAFLDALRADGRDRDIASLVEAVVAPLIEIVDETDGWYGRFLGRSRWEQGAWGVMQDLPTATSFSAAMRLLGRQLTDLPRPIRHHRLDQFMTLVIGTIAGWEGAPDRGEKRLTAQALAAELVTTSVAILTAPSRQLTGAPA